MADPPLTPKEAVKRRIKERIHHARTPTAPKQAATLGRTRRHMHPRYIIKKLKATTARRKAKP